MRSIERQLQLQELFANEEFISLNDLYERLKASRSSLRRDLIALEQKGFLRRVHGGAVSLNPREEFLDYRNLASSNHEEKVRIGKAAAELIQNGQTIILGGGSTTVEVARNLLGRPLQIITNSIPVAQVFWDSRDVEVTLTGGYMYPRVGIQLGPICERMLSGVGADVLIMGVRGITEAGLSDGNSLVVGSIRKMIEVSNEVIIVADHSKFGRASMLHVADLDDLDVVVTDKDVSLQFQQMIEKCGVKCVLA